MTAIELFPCSGGMAEGFRRAGVVFDLAFDKDPNACDSYEANHGHRPVEMDVRDLLRMASAGWRPADGRIDLLVADPPCTPWSRAGKRLGIEDERDMLTITTILIATLRPRAYLIGNVPGLQDSTQWHHVQKFIGGLERYGYCVADYVSLDAADYGVPQHRVRPFWFGHLDGPCVRWPAPTHGAPTRNAELAGCETRPWVTCRDALGHLSGDDLGRPVRIRWKDAGDHRPSEPSEPAKTLTGHGNSDGVVLSMRRAGVDGRKNGGDDTRCSSTDEPARTVVTNANRKGGAIMLTPNAKHPINSADAPSMTVTSKGDARGAQGACAMAWPRDRPATAVMADERLPPPGHHDSDWKDAEGNRQRSAPNAVILSERAAAILQGFPESWRFCGKTKKARWSQLGQAMPPPLAEAVARAIVEQMERARNPRSAAAEAMT